MTFFLDFFDNCKCTDGLQMGLLEFCLVNLTDRECSLNLSDLKSVFLFFDNEILPKRRNDATAAAAAATICSNCNNNKNGDFSQESTVFTGYFALILLAFVFLQERQATLVWYIQLVQIIFLKHFDLHSCLTILAKLSQHQFVYQKKFCTCSSLQAHGGEQHDFAQINLSILLRESKIVFLQQNQQQATKDYFEELKKVLQEQTFVQRFWCLFKKYMLVVSKQTNVDLFSLVLHVISALLLPTPQKKSIALDDQRMISEFQQFQICAHAQLFCSKSNTSIFLPIKHVLFDLYEYNPTLENFLQACSNCKYSYFFNNKDLQPFFVYKNHLSINDN